MSLRYSIYKVHSCCFALARSFLILSQLFEFVKNFFQVFSNFSELFFLAALVSNLVMLAHPFPFVNYFFQVFANFFQLRFCGHSKCLSASIPVFSIPASMFTHSPWSHRKTDRFCGPVFIVRDWTGFERLTQGRVLWKFTCFCEENGI